MTKKKKPEDLLKVGRPTLYKSEYCVKVIELGRVGMSKAQMAREFDVARLTMDDWCSEHPEFLNALTRARDLALAAWEDKADEGIQGQGFNTGLWGRIMSARFPADYREVKTNEVTGANGKDLMPRQNLIQIAPSTTPEQFKAMFDAVVKLNEDGFNVDNP